MRVSRPLILILLLAASLLQAPYANAESRKKVSLDLRPPEVVLRKLWAVAVETDLATALPAPRDQLWDRIDAKALRLGIREALKDEGAYITPRGIYRGSVNAEISLTDEFSTITLHGDPRRYKFLERAGIETCKMTLPASSPPLESYEIVKIIRCSAKEAIQLHARAENGRAGSHSTAAMWIAIRATLARLKEQRHIASSVIDEDRFQVLFRPVSSPVSPITVPIDPTTFSTFASLADELNALRTLAARWPETSIVLLSETEAPIALTINELYSGLNCIDLAKSSDSAVRREAFLRCVGDWDTLVDECDDIESVEYSDAVVTPANDLVVEYTGWDKNQALPMISYAPLKNLLALMGYRIAALQGATMNAGDEHKLCLLRKAQTLMVKAHGNKLGQVTMQCYPAVEADSVACCERARATLGVLGVAPKYPDCSTEEALEYYRYYMSSSGDRGCSRRDSVQRCVVLAPIPTATWPVAGLFSAQCFGGLCQGDSVRKVVDMFTGSAEANYPTTINCDIAQIAKDLGGYSQYCRIPEVNESEPYLGPTCYPETAELYPPADSIRTVQESIELRSSRSPNDEVTICQRAINPSNGLHRFEVANDLGISAQKTEFAPFVSSIALVNGEFRAKFSSAIDPAASAVLVKFKNAHKKRADEPEFLVPPTVERYQAYFTVQGYDLLSEDQWGLTPQNLLYQYGYTQENWPAYAEVTITAAAPSGIGLAGNQLLDWIWPISSQRRGVPGWATFNGIAGEEEFKVKLPIIPSWACCKPNYEFGESGLPVVNGCTCHPLSPQRCISYACCKPLSDGSSDCDITHDISPAECRTMGGMSYSAIGKAHVWADCCEESSTGCARVRVSEFDNHPECPDGPPVLTRTIEYQYTRRPWAAEQIRQCAPIKEMTACSGE